MARNCGDFHFTGNVVRDFGGEGVVLENARNASVRGNVLRGFGLGALRISGGDRKTLTASDVVVSDNDISWVERWKRTYAPGLHLSGCGTEVVHNHFHDMPSAARLAEEPSFRPLPPESALGPRDVPSYRRACANMGCVQECRLECRR